MSAKPKPIVDLVKELDSIIESWPDNAVKRLEALQRAVKSRRFTLHDRWVEAEGIEKTRLGGQYATAIEAVDVLLRLARSRATSDAAFEMGVRYTNIAKD